MARPRKATVDYFPHDVNHGKTTYILESKFGNDGYATWFKLLERLGASDGHYIDLRDKGALLHLTAYCLISTELLLDILNLLADLNAIDGDFWNHNVVFSSGLVARVSDAYKKRTNSLPTKEQIAEKLNLDFMVYPAETGISAPETIVSGGRNPQREREREREREITDISLDDATEVVSDTPLPPTPRKKSSSKTKKPVEQETAKRIRLAFEERKTFLEERFPWLDLAVEAEQCVAKYRDKPVGTDAAVLVLEWCKRSHKPSGDPDKRGSPTKARSEPKTFERIGMERMRRAMVEFALEEENGHDGSGQAAVCVADGRDGGGIQPVSGKGDNGGLLPPPG